MLTPGHNLLPYNRGFKGSLLSQRTVTTARMKQREGVTNTPLESAPTYGIRKTGKRKVTSRFVI